jgi:hypothetical protein
VDPDKVHGAVEKSKEPETKKQVRQIIGLFALFRDYIENFSYIAKPLTDLTAKRVPERVPFHQKERNALNELKRLLCEAVKRPLSVTDMNRPFSTIVSTVSLIVTIAFKAVRTACERSTVDVSNQPV